jgi:hypothetical protein
MYSDDTISGSSDGFTGSGANVGSALEFPKFEQILPEYIPA